MALGLRAEERNSGARRFEGFALGPIDVYFGFGRALQRRSAVVLTSRFPFFAEDSKRLAKLNRF
jgi:hypothetical protein